MPEPKQLDIRVKAPIGALHIEADLTLTAPWTVLFGPSGSGKSSLLRLIAGLWTPADSAVLLHNEDLTKTAPNKRRIALVAQQVALFPNMSVQQNIDFGYRADPTRPGWTQSLIETFGLASLASKKPANLSGGERQRVAIARALGSAPSYLLLDEVFTGMHTPLRQHLIATLRTYSDRLSMPILSVTHDVAEALQADEVIKIEAGRITAQGPPSDVLTAEREALLAQLEAPPAQSI